MKQKQKQKQKVKEKQCSTCKKVLDICNFYKNKSRKDGYQNNCKQCQKNYVKFNYLNNSNYIIARNSLKHLLVGGRIEEETYHATLNKLKKDFNIA